MFRAAMLALVCLVSCGKLGVEDDGRGLAITLSTSELTMVRGETATISATVSRTDGGKGSASFTSSDPSVVTVVSGDGVAATINAVATGNAVVTASVLGDPNRKAVVAVTVRSEISALQITPARAADTVLVGTSLRLNAIVTTTRVGASTTVLWRSRASNVVSVSQDGTATGVTRGAAYIVAKAAADTTVQDSLLVAAVLPAVQSWSLQNILGPVRSDTISAIWALPTGYAFAVTSAEWIGGSTGGNGALYVYKASTRRWNLVDQTLRIPLYGVWAPSRDTAFVVGAAGWIGARIGGIENSISLVRMQQNETGVTLRGIWGTSGTNVYAVGDAGTVLRYDGQAWRRIAQTVTTENLNAVAGYVVAGTGAVGLYAVGDRGTILFGDGTGNWVANAGFTSERLNHVWVRDANDVYAAGDNGVILRYGPFPAPATWRRVDGGVTSARLRMLTGTIDSVVVVGTDGLSGVVLTQGKSSGTAWTRSNHSRAITAVSGQFLGGERGFMALNPTLPQASQPLLSDMPAITGLHVVARDVAYASAVGGRMLKFTGGLCDTIPRLSVVDQSAVWALNADLAWFGGSNGLTRVSVGQASPATLSSLDIRAIHGVSPRFALAVGSGIASFNGTTWTTVSGAPVTQMLRGVWMADSAFAFAVGDNGEILKFESNVWTRMQSPTTARLTAVWAPNRQFAMAVGAGGVALLWDGARWSAPFGAFSTEDLWSVWGARPNDVYVAGSRGYVARFDGITWTSMAVSPGAAGIDWRTISGLPTDGVLMGGSPGFLARGQGPSGIFANGPDLLFGSRGCN